MTQGAIAPRRRPVLLVLLKNDHTLQKLIATWPGVRRPDDEWMLDYRGRRRVRKDWSRLAMVPEFIVLKRWRQMFGNGLVNHDGTVDVAVDMLVLQEMLGWVPEDMRDEIRGRLNEARARAQEQRRKENDGQS